MRKKYVATGLLAGLTAGLGAGFVLQQTGSAGAAPAVVQQEDDTGTDETQVDEQRPEPGQRLQEILAPLVEDGTLTQAQVDAVVQAMVDAGPFRGPGGPGGPGHGHGHHRRGEVLETVAEVLGISVDELRDQLQDGATIADVAGAQTDAVIMTLVADATERINTAVSEGRITQEEADEKIAGLQEKFTNLVNGVRPDRDGDEPVVVEDAGS